MKRLAPERTIAWYRRRRELRIYNRELGDNLWLQRLRTLDAQKSGTPISAEDMVAEGNSSGAWLAWAIHDIVERNDIVLKAMERKIEALSARHGQQLRNLRDELEGIQGRLEAIQGQLAGSNGDAPATEATAGTKATPAPASAE
jgi:hypothetical protein